MKLGFLCLQTHSHNWYTKNVALHFFKKEHSKEKLLKMKNSLLSYNPFECYFLIKSNATLLMYQL